MDFIGGTVKDGHVVPDEPLPEGTRVEIRVRTPGAAPATATLRNGHTKPVTPDTGAAGPDHPRTELVAWRRLPVPTVMAPTVMAAMLH